MTDFTVVLNGLTMGAGTAYQIGENGIDGLGTPPAKTADVDLDGQNGAFGSPDFMGVRVILIPFVISEINPADAWDELALLAGVWLPVTADTQLDIIVPGTGTISYMGRPRSLEANTQYGVSGTITAIGEFHALNPVAL